MSDNTAGKANRIDRIQKYISKMPSLSTTVTKVLEVCNTPSTSPNDLNRVISLDPVLTAKVLRLINSAYYALPDQVTSLTRAIIMLGINTVKNLALATAVLETIGAEKSSPALSKDDFWTHSITVGVTAKLLATVNRIPATVREEYFVAGLLHDLGKIPLTNRFPDEYLKATELAMQEKEPLYVAENTVLGMDHSIVGGMIAEKWEFNQNINESLICHHTPEAAEGESDQLVATVALADTYANTFETVSSEDLIPDETSVRPHLEKVGVSWTQLSELRETVLDEIEKARIFLQVSKEG
jgi:putative nucleotidyltransferase with HDIG domain